MPEDPAAIRLEERKQLHRVLIFAFVLGLLLAIFVLWPESDEAAERRLRGAWTFSEQPVIRAVIKERKEHTKQFSRDRSKPNTAPKCGKLVLFVEVKRDQFGYDLYKTERYWRPSPNDELKHAVNLAQRIGSGRKAPRLGELPELQLDQLSEVVIVEIAGGRPAGKYVGGGTAYAVTCGAWVYSWPDITPIAQNDYEAEPQGYTVSAATSGPLEGQRALRGICKWLQLPGW